MDAFLEEQAAHGLRIIRCVPYPTRWESFTKKHALSWTFVDFNKGGAAAVPAVAGFYCFFVGPAPANLPPAGYPLYAGETQNLQKRYGNYLVEKNSKTGRDHVKKFLKVFEDEVRFAFAEWPSSSPPVTKPGLRAVEKELNDALMPQYSRKDFSAAVKAKIGAWS
jgi:hypothetical protein